MNKPARLAYLSHARIPSRSANSVHVMKMCEGFAQAGCAVALIALRGSDERGLTPAKFYGTSADVRVNFVPEYPTPAGRLLYSWSGALRSRRDRAVWAFGRDLAGCYFAGVLGLPVAHETHFPAGQLQGAKRIMFQRLIRGRHFRKLIVITQVLKASYEQEFALSPDQILVLPDAASEPADAIPAIPPSGRIAVGYVGHLYPGKGMDIIPDLAAACPWADFHVVGGRDEDLRFWQQRCEAHGNIRLHGFVPHGQLASYFASFDAVLAPYQERVTVEGRGDISTFMSPLKLFEYMAARKAIVCSDLPVLREVMRHEDNCLLVPPADIAAWRGALERLRDNTAVRAQLADNAYTEFLHSYTWRARADRILAALKEGPITAAGNSARTT